MRRWNAYWYGNVAAIRPYLFMKGFLVLLALDLFMVRLPFGSKYDATQFNIAHFNWLDAIQPAPRASTYVGVLILAGLLALLVAGAGLGRVARVTLVVLYTYLWAMSRIDGFQHHYLISLMLVCLVFFPDSRATDLFPQSRRDDGQWPGPVRSGEVALTSAWGYSLLAALVAVVFTYTAITKMDAQWWAGHTLASMPAAVELLGPVEQALGSIGVGRAAFWRIVTTSTILIELLIAAGYLAAVTQDRHKTTLLRVCCLVILMMAVLLHLSFTLIRLQIGWFGAYMILIACVYFLPGSWLVAAGWVGTWPVRRYAIWAGARSWKYENLRWVVAAFGVALLLGLVGLDIDLPGAVGACLLAAVTLLAAVLYGAAHTTLSAVRCQILAAFAAGVVMWAAIAISPVRGRFYVYLCGELHRQNRPVEEQVALQKAEQYVDDDDVHGLNNLAWLLATHHDPDLRAPARAVRYAVQARRLSNNGGPALLDTLAVAYASAGRFEEAVRVMEQALRVVSSAESHPHVEEFKQRLKLLRRGIAYIEPPIEDGPPWAAPRGPAQEPASR